VVSFSSPPECFLPRSLHGGGKRNYACTEITAAAAAGSPHQAVVRFPRPVVGRRMSRPASSASCGTCAGAWRTISRCSGRAADLQRRLRCPAAARIRILAEEVHSPAPVAAVRNLGPATVVAHLRPAPAEDRIRPAAAAPARCSRGADRTPLPEVVRSLQKDSNSSRRA
jgi:hypothetical protein